MYRDPGYYIARLNNKQNKWYFNGSMFMRYDSELSIVRYCREQFFDWISDKKIEE